MHAYLDSIIPVLHDELLSQSMWDLPRHACPNNIGLQCHFDYTMHAWNHVNFGIHCDIKRLLIYSMRMHCTCSTTTEYTLCGLLYVTNIHVHGVF